MADQRDGLLHCSSRAPNSCGTTPEGESGEHRAFVGPAGEYDLIGAAQFALLYALGLRERHRLLDVGCGSLRAGRLLISYLAPDRYVGVEPNGWLIEAAVERELGHDLTAIKRPRFDPTADFSLEHLGRFDFVLVHGVATNAGPELMPRLLRAIKAAMAPSGLAAVTFIHPGTGDQGAVEVGIDDHEAAAWRYPGCYSYDRDEIAGAIDANGLVGRPISWFHPRHQWWLLALSAGAMPPDALLATLRGATLAAGWEASWDR